MVHEHFPSNRSPKIAGIEQFVLLYTIIEYFAAREQELSAEEFLAEEPATEPSPPETAYVDIPTGKDIVMISLTILIFPGQKHGA